MTWMYWAAWDPNILVKVYFLQLKLGSSLEPQLSLVALQET